MNEWNVKHKFVGSHPIATWILALAGLWFSGPTILSWTYFGILSAWMTIPLFVTVFFISVRGFLLSLEGLFE